MPRRDYMPVHVGQKHESHSVRVLLQQADGYPEILAAFQYRCLRSELGCTMTILRRAVLGREVTSGDEQIEEKEGR